MTIILFAALLLFACTVFADGGRDWLYSRLNGYVNVDGLGGVTTADAHRVTVISKNASVCFL